MPSTAAADPPAGEALATAATSGAAVVAPPEQLLSEDNARAYRRFLDWSVGAGFKLGVVEVTEPWRRDALVAWTAATVPGTRVVRLNLASQEPLRGLLEASAATIGMAVLVLTHLEEASDRRVVCAQLNVQRDDLARLLAVPWVIMVHPSAALDLQRYAPDFSDFAGLWLSGGEAEVAAVAFKPVARGQAMVTVNVPYGGGDTPGSELLVRSDAAVRAGRLDEARDLLAQHELAHPEAAESVGRAMVDARLLVYAGDLVGARAKLESLLAACERDQDGTGVLLVLRDLGRVLVALGKHGEAENVFRRSLALLAGADHPNNGVLLQDLAIVRERQGKYGEAESLLRQALAIQERTPGVDQSDYAASLSALASVQQKLGHYQQAEGLLRQALAIQEKALGIDHPDHGTSLNDLASVLRDQNRYGEAEGMLRRSLAIQEKTLGVDHPTYGEALYILASVLRREGKLGDAANLLRQALAIDEKALGAAHPNYAVSLHALATVLEEQGKHEEAENLLRQALAIQEKALRVDHPDYGASMNNLASVLHAQGKYGEAEGLLRQALAIQEKALGVDHPVIYSTLTNLGVILAERDRSAEAEPLIQRALRIAEHAHGAQHPDTAQILDILAQVQFALGRPEAKDTAQRALATLGPEHPVTRQTAPTLRVIPSGATAVAPPAPGTAVGLRPARSSPWRRR
jgi:tetratricopeptide (TPR) repeat protein